MSVRGVVVFTGSLNASSRLLYFELQDMLHLLTTRWLHRAVNGLETR